MQEEHILYLFCFLNAIYQWLWFKQRLLLLFYPIFSLSLCSSYFVWAHSLLLFGYIALNLVDFIQKKIFTIIKTLRSTPRIWWEYGRLGFVFLLLVFIFASVSKQFCNYLEFYWSFFGFSQFVNKSMHACCRRCRRCALLKWFILIQRQKCFKIIISNWNE